MVTITILDVGHGLSCIVNSSDAKLVIDGGPGATLHQYLKATKLDKINAILVSHADHDHIGGLIEVLLDGDVAIEHVYINSDAKRQSAAWDDLLQALAWRFPANRNLIGPLTSSQSPLHFGELSFEVFWPHQLDMLRGGAGGFGSGGNIVTANSASGVIRMSYRGTALAFLGGDMEQDALQDLVDNSSSCTAYLLIFPHHGGSVKANDIEKFVAELLGLVEPSVVVFSVDSDLYKLPRKDVMESIRKHRPNTRIMCTQLSCHCRQSLPGASAGYAKKFPSRGQAAGKCCSGTIVITFDGSAFTVHPNAVEHSDFIKVAAPSARCS